MSARLLALTILFALAANAYMTHALLFSDKAAYATAESPARSGSGEIMLQDSLQRGEGTSETLGAGNSGRVMASSVSDRYDISYPVDSEEAAEQAVRDAGSDLGLDLTRYNYRCISHDHHHLMDTYVLNQTYKEVPLLGYVLTMTVEAEGKIRTIIGREARVPDSVDSMLSSVIGEEKAKKIWNRHLEREYGKAGREAKKTIRGLHILCQEGEEARLVYIFRADRKESMQSAIFHVDALSGDVESFGNMTEAAMAHLTVRGQTGEKDLALDLIRPDQALVRDTNRHIGVYAYGKEGEAISINPTRKADGLDPVKQSAVDALYNIQRAWQYFARTQGRKGFNGDDTLLKIYVGLPEGNLNDNGVLVRNPAGQQYILIGHQKKNPCQVSAWLDLMGHEYTHGMINEAWDREFGLTYPLENDVLSEGLADVFGELIEDSYDGTGKASYYDNSCDWISMKYTSAPRSAKEARNDQVTAYRDMESLEDAHDGAYLISHCAWLMTRGIDGTEEKKVNNLRLGQLFYNAFWSVNSMSTLEDFRFALENTAAFLCRTGRISSAQLDCVIDALDQTGIPGCADYCLASESDLTVLDQDHAPIKESLVTISDLAHPDKDLVSKEAFTGKIHIKTQPGFYYLTLTDSEENRICSLTLRVNEAGLSGNEKDGENGEDGDYQKSVTISTPYMAGKTGGDIVVIPGLSGMVTDGEQKALLSYVDSLLGQIPSSRIHIIGAGGEESPASGAEAGWQPQNDLFTRTAVDRAILSLTNETGMDPDAGLGLKAPDLEGALACAKEILSSGPEKGGPKDLVLISNEKDPAEMGNLTQEEELSQSLKKEGIDIICIDARAEERDGSDQKTDSFRDIASSASFYPASTDKNLNKVLRHLSLRQTHPGLMSRLEIAGRAGIGICQDGEEVLSWHPSGPESSSSDSSPVKEGTEKNRDGEKYGMSLTSLGLVWREKDQKDRLIFELYPGSGSGYELSLQGVGKESVDLLLSYQDKDGNYADSRRFEGIATTDKSLVFASLEPEKESFILIDRDGNGRIDRMEKAGRKGTGKVTSGRIAETVGKIFLLFLALSILALLLPALAGKLITAKRERKGGPVCIQCGMRNKRGARACRRCGKLLPAPQEGHESKFSRGQEKKINLLPRILVVLLLLILTFAHVRIGSGPAASAYTEFVSNHQTAGTYFYQGLGQGNLNKTSCDFLLNRYIRRLDQDKKIDKEKVKILKKNYKRISQ